jgi:hypothetical protein
VTKRNLLVILLVLFIFVDVACLVFGRQGSWLAGFGARGLVLDFLLGIVVLFQYIKGEAE